MGKTPAQENRERARKAGMSHDKVKSDAAKDAHKLKELGNKDLGFGKAKGAGLNTQAEKAKQRLRDLADPTSELGRAAERDARKRQKEELEFLLHKRGISVKQPVLAEGQDPKTVLCQYFLYDCCSKTAERCRFSHDRGIAEKIQAKKRALEEEKLEEKRNIYETQEDLEACIEGKHGSEKTQNATAIVCKFFLDAIETHTYGWFWGCPNGETCQYRHKLPEGYVLKSDLRAMMMEERLSRRTDDDVLLEKLAALEMGTNNGISTTLTDDVFAGWRKRKYEQRVDIKAKVTEERHKKNLLTGRELMEKGMIGVEDEDAWDMTEYLSENKNRDEAMWKASYEQAAEFAAFAQARRGEEPEEEEPVLLPAEDERESMEAEAPPPPHSIPERRGG